MDELNELYEQYSKKSTFWNTLIEFIILHQTEYSSNTPTGLMLKNLTNSARQYQQFRKHFKEDGEQQENKKAKIHNNNKQTDKIKQNTIQKNNTKQSESNKSIRKATINKKNTIDNNSTVTSDDNNAMELTVNEPINFILDSIKDAINNGVTKNNKHMYLIGTLEIKSQVIN